MAAAPQEGSRRIVAGKWSMREGRWPGMVNDELSAGNPPGESIRPECAVVVARLWTLIDGECHPAICESLLRHLDDCSDCMSRFKLEARIKLLIATKCAGDTLPQKLAGEANPTHFGAA